MRWYYGWNVIAVAMAFQAILFGFTLFSFTLWANEWVTEFDASFGEVMLGVTIFTVVQGSLAPFAGRAMDVLSIRTLVCAGAILSVVGIALISQVTAVWQILAIYSTLIGLGMLLAGPLAAQTLAAKWFRGRRGFAVGISTVGTSLGGFFMPPLVTWLFVNVGWRDAHLILAAITLATVVPLVWWIIRNGPEELGIDADPESEVSAARAATVYPEWTTLSILRERTFWIMIFAFVPMTTALAGVQHNLGPLAKDSGITPQNISFLVSAFAGCAALGKVFFGAVADRWDLRQLYWLANALLVACMAVFMLQPGYGLLLVASALLGLAAGGFLPLLASIISTRFGPKSFGRVMGLVGPFTLVTALGPWFAGNLRDGTGSYETALQIFIGILVPAAIVMTLLKPMAPTASRALPAE